MTRGAGPGVRRQRHSVAEHGSPERQVSRRGAAPWGTSATAGARRQCPADARCARSSAEQIQGLQPPDRDASGADEDLQPAVKRRRTAMGLCPSHQPLTAPTARAAGVQRGATTLIGSGSHRANRTRGLFHFRRLVSARTYSRCGGAGRARILPDKAAIKIPCHLAASELASGTSPDCRRRPDYWARLSRNTRMSRSVRVS